MNVCSMVICIFVRLKLFFEVIPSALEKYWVSTCLNKQCQVNLYVLVHVSFYSFVFILYRHCWKNLNAFHFSSSR